jgi:hypothetical protein
MDEQLVPIRFLSPDQEDVIDLIKREVVWLHAAWDMYNLLFGHSDERMEILSNSVPNFFFFCSKVLVR